MSSRIVGDNNEINLQVQPLEARVVSVASASRNNTYAPNVGVIDSNVALPQFVPHGMWMSYPQPYFQNPQQNVMGSFVSNQMIAQPMSIGDGAPFADSQVATASPVNVIGNASHSNEFGIKRGLQDNIVEKNDEKKLKRMIRNRESALRSRARKQVYTIELEIKVSRLEEENEKLRKELKDFKNKLANAQPLESKCHLRRVSSATF